MYPENLVVPVELVLPMGLVYTCPALGSPLQGNLIRYDRISSNCHMVKPLEVRKGAGPSESLWILSWSSSKFWTFAILSIFSRSVPVFADLASIIFGIAPLPNGFAAFWWLFSTTVLMTSIASSSYLLMKVPPLAASKRHPSCGPNPS